MMLLLRNGMRGDGGAEGSEARSKPFPASNSNVDRS